MKLAIALLVFLPLASATLKPFFGSPIVASISHLLHLDEFETLVRDTIAKMGSDESEQSCDTSCIYEVKHLLSAGPIESISEAGCPAICASIKQLAIQFGIHAPHLFDATTPPAAK